MSVDPSNEVAERGIPQVGRPRKGNRWFLLAFVALGIVLVMALAARAMLGALASRTHTSHGATLTPAPPDLTRTAFEGQSTPPPPPPSSASAGTSTLSGQTSAPMTPAQKAAADLAERRKRAPLLAIGGTSLTTQSAAEQPAAALPDLEIGSREQQGQPPQSTLSNALSATRTAQVSASLLPDPNMTLTQGMFLDCILQTALSSEVPGMTSCVLARNIYSTNGKVLLLERGSRLVGQYQAAQLRQGQSRIFVLWTRAETPNGVIINLDSPSTDALGRSGLAGTVDNHFWARFGSALLVSVVDDLASNAVQDSGGSNNNSLTFTNTTNSANDAAAIIVENSVNIPPTLTKAQGAHVNIFVARDLYFGNVYGLTAAR
ncbi:MAG: Inner membrane protein of type IV secretion of T-DNA complex, TonB-like, VirB10 [Rhodanobacteraceae bacterium]|jgi:type IV secretion system protein VirB10|nr:MAG: Inner membrane protein of type IV secretion of T-DNA complex, TonB-like, VirB10 [Rhodanobacteraceae bacterium]